MDKRILLVSFSGGKTSAYMTWWLLNIKYKAIWSNESTQQDKQSKKVHMLSRCRHVFAKLEESAEVSNEISTYAPGTRDKFSL